MEALMVKMKAASIAVCVLMLGCTSAQARTFDYCKDSSGETLSLLVKVLGEMRHEPDTTDLERKSIVYQIERLQGCQVYKDYQALCRTLHDECAE
jgi:hypothetical protein